MSGRGFLKSRLAQVAPKEPEEPPKLHEPPKSEELPKLAALPIPHTDVPNVPVAAISSQTLVAGNQQVVRGRRVIIVLFVLIDESFIVEVK